MSFFLVSSGPFGQEEALSAGGALYSFLATILVPLFFALPLALISSEQATRLPACGGAVEWGRILGRPMALFNCYIRISHSIFDNALYPVLICDYLCALAPWLDRLVYRIAVGVGANVLAIACNVVGLDAVGCASSLLAIAVLAPFVPFVVFAWREMTADRIFAVCKTPDMARLLATVMWQFSGFDTVAALSSETDNPRRTFPIALLLTIACVTVFDLLPTMAGISVEPDPLLWSSGAFAEVAKTLPHCENGWLSAWLSVAGALAALSLLNVAISCTGREFYAGGVIEAFPFSQFFAQMSDNCRGDPVPLRGMAAVSLLALPMSALDFGLLVSWSGFLGAIAQLIQVAIFVALRMPRPAREGLLEDGRGEEEEANDQFIIGGGWPIAILVSAALVASCVILIIEVGWEPAVLTAGLVGIFWTLKGADTVVRMLVEGRPAIAPEPPLPPIVATE
jgi:amino acid transporter